VITAHLDPSLRAVLGPTTPLLYASGAAPLHDRPAHIRAASAVRRLGDRLVIVQDDVNVLALHLVAGDGRGSVPVLLPRGEGGARVFGDERGNKRAKMDLEACAALPDGRLVAMGSGSTPARERLVVLEASGAVRVVDGAPLYRALRAATAFAGSELNVEGAVVLGDRLRLFQRGNGAVRGDLAPINATGDLDLAAFVRFIDGAGAAPPLGEIMRFDLGAIGATPLGFTDATVLADGRVAFVACAEASPDTFRDGEVLGCRFGVVEAGEARACDVLDASGARSTLKLEGLEASDDPGRLHVVADRDRHDEPALLADLVVTGA
jgi:hypothetical protein